MCTAMDFKTWPSNQSCYAHWSDGRSKTMLFAKPPNAHTNGKEGNRIKVLHGIVYWKQVSIVPDCFDFALELILVMVSHQCCWILWLGVFIEESVGGCQKEQICNPEGWNFESISNSIYKSWVLVSVESFPSITVVGVIP